jgi:hypothetical protein
MSNELKPCPKDGKTVDINIYTGAVFCWYCGLEAKDIDEWNALPRDDKPQEIKFSINPIGNLWHDETGEKIATFHGGNSFEMCKRVADMMNAEMMKHEQPQGEYGEPWDYEGNTIAEIGQASGKSLFYRGKNICEINATNEQMERAAECVNATRGIRDVQKFMDAIAEFKAFYDDPAISIEDSNAELRNKCDELINKIRAAMEGE